MGRAVVAGDEITTTAELEESSERGAFLFVFRTVSTNDRARRSAGGDGEHRCEGRWTNIVR